MPNPAIDFRMPFETQFPLMPNLRDSDIKHPSIGRMPNPAIDFRMPFDAQFPLVPNLRDSDIEYPSIDRMPFANRSPLSSNLRPTVEPEPSSLSDGICGISHRGLWRFGVEIEIIVAPSSNVPRYEDLGPIAYRRYWYDRFQRFLNERDNRQGEGSGLLSAHADPLHDGSYSKCPSNYNKWYITEDMSLKPELETKYECKRMYFQRAWYRLLILSTLVPMEISSPILQTIQDWRGSINSLWSEIERIFRVKQGKTCCGSHVHISPVGRNFTISELKKIAKFVLMMEEHIFNLLPQTRRHHRFCELNTFVSPRLKGLKARGKSGAVYGEFCLAVGNCRNEQELCHLMQEGYSTSQRTLWNFNNTFADGKGTVEFRGGRHLQGPERTKAWITLALSLVHLAIYKVSS
jgi:hypothetical protein